MPNVRKNHKFRSTTSPTGAQESNKLQRRRQRHTGNHLILTAFDADQAVPSSAKRSQKGVGITFGVTRDKGALSVLSSQMEKLIGNMCGITEDINGLWPDLRRIYRRVRGDFNIPPGFGTSYLQRELLPCEPLEPKLPCPIVRSEGAASF